jgi:hypothetical protein
VHVRGRSVHERFALLDFTVVGYLVGCAALRGGEGVVVFVREVLPEVGTAVDDGGVAEGFLEGRGFVEIAGDEVDALDFPFLGRGLVGVSGDAADGPAWFVEKDAGD